MSLSDHLRDLLSLARRNRPNLESVSSLEQLLPGYVYRCRFDEKWTMLYLSEQVKEITGYEPEELVDNRLLSYEELIHPSDRRGVRHQVQEALRENRPFELEYRIRARDGSSRWVWEQGKALRDDANNVQHLEGFVQDITDRKQLELEDHALREASEIISGADDFETSVNRILRIVCDLTDWEYAEIWVPDRIEERSIDARVHYNPDNGDLETFWEQSRTVECEPGKGLVGRVWESGELEWIDNTQTSRSFLRSSLARKAGLRSAVGIPCLSEGEVEAVMVIYMRKKPGGKGLMLGLLETIARHLGPLFRRKRLEEELHERETMFRQLAETMELDLWIIDPEYRAYQYTNPSFQRTWGDYFDNADDIVEAFLNAVVPEDRDRVRKQLPEQSDQGYSSEFRITRPTDGERRWYRDQAFPVTNEEGEVVRIVGFGRDVTPRVEAQEELEEYHKRFRQIVENIREVFYLYNRDYSEVLYVSPRYEEVWDRSVDELYRSPWSFIDAVHPEDREEVVENKKEFLEVEDRSERSDEYRIVCSDDSIRWVRDQMFQVKSGDGEVVRIAGVVEDITEEKRILRNLERSLEEKNTLLQEVHHRVRNNLQMVMSLLALQMRESPEDTQIQTKLQDVKNRIYSIALTHDQLYRSENLSDVETGEYIVDLTNQIVRGLSSPSQSIQTEFRIDEVRLNIDTIIPVGLILTELVTNAIEHGFADRSEGRLVVEFRRLDGKTCELVVRDTGRGWREAPPPQELDSFGLNVVNTLAVEQLNGEIEMNDVDGVEFRITLRPRSY